MLEYIYFISELLLRMIIAAICGIMIGYERKSHFKVAGVKTHMSVGLSAALMMIVSKYAFFDVAEYDAARIAAQVVSGVGFLGAGIIYKRDYSVQGLTTAAGIWGTAGVGLAIGSGLYLIGIVGTIIYILLSIIMQKVDKFQNGHPSSYVITTSKMSRQDLLSLCDTYKVLSFNLKEIESQKIMLDVTILFKTEAQEKAWVNSLLSCNEIDKIKHY